MGRYFLDIQYYKISVKWMKLSSNKLTACQRSSDKFYLLSYYIKRVTTSWTHSKNWDNIEFNNEKIYAYSDMVDEISSVSSAGKKAY